MVDTTKSTFEAPGPGQWALDRSHYPGGTTPISEWLIVESMPAGLGRVFEEIGAPLSHIQPRFVNGFMYTRVWPLIGGDKPSGKLPPTPILKIVARTHPEFRRRAKRAAATMAERPSLAVVERWDREIRPELLAANHAFQEIDVASLDDAALDHHVSDLLDHARTNFELHFWLHGHDLGPIARYLYECIEWGLEPDEAITALSGASPSTSRPIETLCQLRELVEHAGAPVTSLDDVRAISPVAAELLDGYLADRGEILATGYDLTSFRLSELPGLVLSSIRSAQRPSTGNADAIARRLRELVPPDGHDEFDEVLHDARAVMDMRDDNGPLTTEWPIGLLRRALLEVGRRLVARGDAHEPEHALELERDEARRALTGDHPTADELAARASRRAELTSLEPPETLGDTEAEPPPDILPRPLPKLVGMVQVSMKYMGMDGTGEADNLTGAGVGTVSYTGRARTAASADEAIESLEPGDVLVVRATSPAFNAVLALAGAVVTANGGPLSHAAVLSRELGIPAVVGASGALSIPDGATVEVDPVAGEVRIVG